MDMTLMLPQPYVPPGAAARTRDLNYRQVFEGIIGWLPLGLGQTSLTRSAVSLHQEVAVSNWKINEQAAGRIVLSAARMAKQYSVFTAKLDSKAKQMVEVLPHSEFVSVTAEGWVQNCGAPGVLSVKGSTNVAIKGVLGAIAAYHEGNLGMAGNTQMMASAADFPKELPKADGISSPVPLGDE